MYNMGKDPRETNQNPVEKAQQVAVSSGSSGKPSKPSGKGRKVPLPTDICWRSGKGRHQRGQPCKAVEAVCRNCSIKGHYEKVCMKGKSTHLVDVPSTSNHSEPWIISMNMDTLYMLMQTYGQCYGN